MEDSGGERNMEDTGKDFGWEVTSELSFEG
jgi:hypothetical protein